jgi:hypothetical protein
MLWIPHYLATAHQAHNPNNYGRALISALLQATAPNPHTNLLNVYIQIANKMGVKKKEKQIMTTNNVQIIYHSMVTIFLLLLFSISIPVLCLLSFMKPIHEIAFLFIMVQRYGAN